MQKSTSGFLLLSFLLCLFFCTINGFFSCETTTKPPIKDTVITPPIVVDTPKPPPVIIDTPVLPPPPPVLINIPPNPVIVANTVIEQQPAVTELIGSYKGDSIVYTNWSELSRSAYVDIESPDSLKTKVYIYKKGTYKFQFLVGNVRGQYDTSTKVIYVQ